VFSNYFCNRFSPLIINCKGAFSEHFATVFNCNLCSIKLSKSGIPSIVSLGANPLTEVPQGGGSSLARKY